MRAATAKRLRRKLYQDAAPRGLKSQMRYEAGRWAATAHPLRKIYREAKRQYHGRR